MLELSAILLIYVAVTLHYGTTRVQGRARLPALEHPARSALARIAAAAALVISGLVWSRQDSGTAAALVMLAGLMVGGTAVTLLGPIAPRVLLVSACAAAIAAPVLALSGAGS